jgi:hypothetical protein
VSVVRMSVREASSGGVSRVGSYGPTVISLGDREVLVSPVVQEARNVLVAAARGGARRAGLGGGRGRGRRGRLGRRSRSGGRSSLSAREERVGDGIGAKSVVGVLEDCVEVDARARSRGVERAALEPEL